jgi:hypothetical protein
MHPAVERLQFKVTRAGIVSAEIHRFNKWAGGD